MVSVAVPAAPPVAESAPGLLAWAKSLRIDTTAGYKEAGERFVLIDKAIKEVEAYFKPMKQAADAAKRQILDKEKAVVGPLHEAKRLTHAALLEWSKAEERSRLELQRRLQAEADEKARREREALEKKAAAAKRHETKQRYAEEALSKSAPVVSVSAETPKIPGVAPRKVWRARVVDATKVPREFLMVDESKLNKFAVAMGGQAKVDGVEFYQEESLTRRGGA